jgi:hypothetical protein
MRSYRGRANHLDRQLRTGAPKADDAFVASLAAELPARRAQGSRKAFASAIAVVVLGTFASFGGVGYAAEGATHAASVAKDAVAKTSASDQYGSTKPVEPAPPSEPPVRVAAATAASPPKSTLPFTGLSLIGTVGLGAALFVVGLAIRRRENDA